MKVSVVIPAYNAANTIAACLTALKKQTVDPASYEVIVVDDGSQDDTASLVEREGCCLIRNDRNQGAAAARNVGMRKARGEIICFTDADCVPQPNWIAEITSPLSEPGITGAKGVYRSNQGQLVARFVQLEYEDKYDRMRGQPRIDFVDTYSAAYRRQVLLENDGFDEQIFYVEDQELSFRLAARGYEMVFQPTAVVYHRHSDTVLRYARKKFMIGYWKARVIRRFPGRAMNDSHTPQVVKLQMLLAGLLLLFTAGLLITPLSGIALVASCLFFLLSALPFSLKAWPKDRTVAVAAPLLLFIRALALGFGLGWGLIR